MLYDHFGQEIQIKKQPETREIAVTTIRDRWGEYPSNGLTPSKLAAIFKQADMGNVLSQAELFEEMEEKDTHLFSQLQTRKNAVLGLDYDITPCSESAEDRKIKDFVADCIYGLDDFEEAMLDLLDALGKGYSICEILWRIDSGKAIIGGLQWIHAKKAVFYERGAADMWAKSYERPRILTEADQINGEIMPPFKMVYHKYKARSGYDTRAGLLRVCAWMYLFKNYGIKDWVAFAEVYGIPLRLGRYDAGASVAEKNALAVAIRSLGSDAAGIISKNTEIEFIESVKNSGSDNLFEALAAFCDKQMSKAILGQTATTEGTPGKLGNEDAQDKVRHDLMKADCESLSRTIRFQIIRPLVGYNFGWDKPLPWFKLMYEPAEDLVALSTVYKNLIELGQPISQTRISEIFKVPLPAETDVIIKPGGSEQGKVYQYHLEYGVLTTNEVRNTLGLPPVAGGDKLIAPIDESVDRSKNTPLSAKQAFPRGDRPFRRVVIASGGGSMPQNDSDTADIIADRLGIGAMNATDDAFMAPIKRLLDRSKSLEEFRDNLIDLYGEMNPADLGAIIERAMIIADLAGRDEVQGERGKVQGE